MIGTILGNRYELLEKIGEGGMAEVYKAKCHLLNRFVAVKILKKEFNGDNTFVEKFKSEAKAAASLSDTNIVNIYDVGSEGGINYIVMEYVNGKTLKQIIQDEIRLDYYKAIDIAIQIGKALDCAHSNNLIHRDIKPHNILVTKDNTVKVTDFGIAKASDSATISDNSKIMGSAHYFSPEQAKGSDVDFRTDIYSFGVVMYEMVTGKVPYDAESPVSIALKHIQDNVVPPKRLVPSIPASLNDLIIKAMAKEPANRYQTAKEILFDLNKIKNDPDYSLSAEDDDDADKTRIMSAVNYPNNTKNQDNKDDDDDDDYYFDDDDSKKKGISKKTKIILIVSGVIVLLAIVFGVSYAVSRTAASKGNVTSNTVSVPSIKGKLKEDAQKILTEKKLKMLVIGSKASDEPEGTVIECSPSEGTSVKLDSTVRVSLSSGKSDNTVPDLTGKTIENAKSILSYYDLKLGNQTDAFSDEIDKGLIIKSNPEKGTKIDKGGTVDIVISKGPQDTSRVVPNIVGKSKNVANTILEANGFKLGDNTIENEVPNNSSLIDKICSQDPPAGSSAKQGSTVNYGKYIKASGK